MTTKINIYIKNNQDETLQQVQYANSIEQAQQLIKTVMPKLKTGYSYVIA